MQMNGRVGVAEARLRRVETRDPPHGPSAPSTFQLFRGHSADVSAETVSYQMQGTPIARVRSFVADRSVRHVLYESLGEGIDVKKGIAETPGRSQESSEGYIVLKEVVGRIRIIIGISKEFLTSFFYQDSI